MDARQWDYGVECFAHAVRLDPENVSHRKLKYRCCRKMHKSAENAAGRSSVKLADVRRKILQAQLQKKWATVDKLAEDGIVLQPWDAPLFAHVATAATELGRTEIARYTWAIALKLDRNNIAYNRACGRFLCIDGDYDGAHRCFARILEVSRDARHAVEMLQHIEVERLMHRVGYADAETTRDVQVTASPDPALSAPNILNHRDNSTGNDDDGVRDEAVALSSRELASLLQAGQQAANERQWQQCVEIYAKALQISPDDMSIRERMEDAELSLRGEYLNRMQRAAEKETSSDRLKLEAAEFERNLIVRRVQILGDRAARHRKDMSIRFRLAEDYSRLGQYHAAIPLFQQACQNLKLRNEALLRLGQCWICDGKKDLASRQFTLALKTLSPVEDAEAFKTAHYWLGRINESEGRSADAETHYAEVLLVDYGFRDTVNRLESLQHGSLNTTPQ